MRLWNIIIVLILLLAAGLRFHNLEVQSLWNDEGSSYVQATRSFTQIATNAAADIHPPGYYWLLKLWRTAAGDTEFALRFPSALASLLTVAVVHAIGTTLYPQQRRYGLLTGTVAALLVALNTFSLYYAQEARMYALLALWAALSLWALARLLYRPTLPNALLLGVFNALGLWTQYAFPLVMLAQGAIALVALAALPRKPRLLATYTGGNLLALLLFAPLLPTALRQVTTWPNTGAGAGVAESLGAVVSWLTFGITHAQTNTSWVALALILALLGLRDTGLAYANRLQQAHSRWRSLLPLLWVIIPVGIFVAAGLYREGNVKFLLPSQLGLALAIGQGVASLWYFTGRNAQTDHASHTAPTISTAEVRRARSGGVYALLVLMRALAIVLLVGLVYYTLLAVPPLYTDPAYQRSDYRAIAAQIQAGADANDSIILNAPGQREVFAYYYDGPVEPVGIPFGLSDTPEQIETATRNELRNADDIFVLLWGDTERDPQGVVERTLDANAFEVDNTWYGDVRLARYVTEADFFDVVNQPNARFGDEIVLERYALNNDAFRPGEVLQLRLFWRARQPLDQRYKVTVQLIDPNGALVAQRDAEPRGGQAPTDTWTPGRTITDNHALLIPPIADSANLTLIVALYNSQRPNDRLSVSTSQADYLTLTTIQLNQAEERP